MEAESSHVAFRADGKIYIARRLSPITRELADVSDLEAELGQRASILTIFQNLSEDPKNAGDIIRQRLKSLPIPRVPTVVTYRSPIEDPLGKVKILDDEKKPEAEGAQNINADPHNKRKCGKDLCTVATSNTDAPDWLSETDKQEITDLFNSPEDGFDGYALAMQEGTRGDLENRKEGDKDPLGKKEALAFLLEHLTPPQMQEIEKNFTRPVIVMRPIVVYSEIFGRKKNYNMGLERLCYKVRDIDVHTTKFYENELEKEQERDGITPSDGTKIIGWEIGIADGANSPNFLDTDWDASKKGVNSRMIDNDDLRDPMGIQRVGPTLEMLIQIQNIKSNVRGPNYIEILVGAASRENPSEKKWLSSTSRVEDAGVACARWSDINQVLTLTDLTNWLPSWGARMRLAVMFREP